jgi:hypothetical protein
MLESAAAMRTTGSTTSVSAIFAITASFADDFPKLLDQVDQKLLDLTNERIKGVKLDPRREGETDMGYIVDSCGKRSIKFQAYRRADYPNASDVDAPNEHQKQFRAFKDNYVKVLSERLPYYQPALRIHLLGLRDQHELFTSTKIREPSDPLHAPAMLATLIEGKEDTSSDRAISHRYKITTGKEVALKPSPWTKWYTPQDPGKRAQLLIGDGYALADKTRNIWGTLRPENSVSEAPPVAKAEELLLAKITGHGIMRWPEPPMHPMV